MSVGKINNIGGNNETVYWYNTITGTYSFSAQNITLSRPCKKVCVLYGVNNTSINVDNDTYTIQYGNPQIMGVLTLTRGQTKYATQVDRGQRAYTLSNDGKTVQVGASSYQDGYQTPALIFSLE